jgi:outer membrane protein TolC
MRFIIRIVVACAAIQYSASPVDAAGPLSLTEAVSIAVRKQDPTVTAPRERAAALSEKAVADSQLPDPALNVGVLNLPGDTFDFTQEPVTQAKVGLQQQFPPGRTRSVTRHRRLAEAGVEEAAALLQETRIKRETRINWLELYYWLGARQKVEESQRAVRELVSVAKSIFATGRQNSQDVLRAELELSLLDDRLIDVRRRVELARADLARYIGRGAASRPLAAVLPNLPAPPAEARLRRILVGHPSVVVEDTRIEVREHDIELAREQYKPRFSVGLEYAARGGRDMRGERPDFLSGKVSMSLPFFTGNRQDRNLSAAHRRHSSAMLSRSARLLELDKALTRTYADWQRLGERITLYRQVVIQRAADTAKASLTAYRSGVADFAELIRSRLALLDNELMLLRLRANRAQAHAKLLFLAGK